MGQEALGPAPHPAGGGGHAEPKQHGADDRDDHAGGRGLHEKHKTGGGAGHQHGAQDVQPSAGALRGDGPPQRRHDKQAEGGQGDDGAPAGRLLDEPARERAERADRGSGAGDPPERRGAHPAVVAGADDGHAEDGDCGRTGALEQPRREQQLVRRGQGSQQRAARHEPDADDERQPNAGQVGDPAVDGGRDGQHQRVQADDPGRAAGGEPEVRGDGRERDGDRCTAHAGEPEQRADEQGDAAGVGGGGAHLGANPGGGPASPAGAGRTSAGSVPRRARQTARGSRSRRSARRGRAGPGRAGAPRRPGSRRP